MAQKNQNDFLKVRELRGTGAYEKINESLARLVSSVDWFVINAEDCTWVGYNLSSVALQFVYCTGSLVQSSIERDLKANRLFF